MEQNVIGIPAFSIVIHGKEKGLYVFANEGASGKTCLKRLIDRCHVLGEPVSGFTYEDCLQGRRPLDICKPTDRLAVMDRYDMCQPVRRRSALSRGAHHCSAGCQRCCLSADEIQRVHAADGRSGALYDLVRVARGNVGSEYGEE